jgi:transposase
LIIELVELNGISKLTNLWMHLSTLKKGEPMDIPLNPSRYELNQLKNLELDDFELIKKGKKYYAHLSITKEIEDKPINSVGGIDQGLNHPIAIVLLSKPTPYEGLIGTTEKEEKLEKFEKIIGELQEAKKFKKLRKLRNKSKNIAINYDWQIANEVAELSQGCLLGIGDSDFRKTQFRGNGMPKLRKRIGKWSYLRQRAFITLKRAELGYQTLPINEYGTSQQCYKCGSKMVKRKWLPTGKSYILCWDCGLKKDSDISSAYLIAFRCMDELLKVRLNWPENLASVQDGCPSIY